MSLVGEAMGLPGLPILSQSLATSFTAARRWAVRLSRTTVAGVHILLIAGWVRTQLLSFVFGDSFDGFGYLVLPIGFAQLVFAFGSGFWLLAKAVVRGVPSCSHAGSDR